MASSSSTSPQLKYNVFISFRGEDTGHNFTSHLYKALDMKSIVTFIDDELNRGDEISSSLFNAIEHSQISVVIFSKRYASSRWCLQELVKVIECRETHGQIVIPVFYQVDPSHVRSQNGTFGDGFAELVERFKEKLEMLQMWRTALNKAANLSGCHISDDKSEARLMEDIVNDILKKLNDVMPPIDHNENLVGVESKIKEIERLLNFGSKNVVSIGIWGTGGIGKTTIAHAVFNKISTQFQGYYFARSVKEESEKHNGLIFLREKLLSTLLGDSHPNIECSFTERRLGLLKILIVLDDVTSFLQIEKLIGDPKIFGLGSRIIITTRDKQVFKNFGVDKIYKVKELLYPQDLHLFRQYAFKENSIPEDYVKLSHKVLEYAKGLPLALKVLGSSLFDKTKEQWDSAINRLEEASPLDILDVLKVSYDGLGKFEKNIFLDIACFFKSEDKDLAIRFLDASGFFAEYGISVLIDKCLITISWDDKILMHDLLREMGRQIVQEESGHDPSRCSRLWHDKDIYDVLTNITGTKAIQGILLDISTIQEIHLEPVAFSNMHNLRFLKVYDSKYENANKVHGFEGLEFDFSSLRFFSWHRYLSKSLPSNFRPSNLVTLDMPYNNLEKLWTGVQSLVSLTSIDLRYSKHLRIVPDLSQIQNLKRLILLGCTRLFKIHSSVWHLKKLDVLDLKDCRSLVNFPTRIHSKSLKELTLSGCSNLKMVPEMSCTIERLSLCETSIEKLASSIEHLSSLVDLNLNYCSKIASLPNNLYKLKSLKSLQLDGCSKLSKIPEMPCSIQNLCLNGTASEEIELGRLEKNDGAVVSHGRRLTLAPIENIQRREGQERVVAMVVPDLWGLSSLTSLDLSYRNIIELPNSLFELSSLFYLNLAGNNFESLPTSIMNLSRLKILLLTYCCRLQSLPGVPFIDVLGAKGCKSLKAFSILLDPMEMKDLIRYDFINCLQLDRDALRDFVEDTLHYIQHNAYRESHDLKRSMCFPGSDIPEWFNFQNSGSFVELPRDSLRKNVVDIACCVVLGFRDYHYEIGSFNVHFILRLKSIESIICCLFGWLNGEGPHSIESDHVFLGCFSLVRNYPDIKAETTIIDVKLSGTAAKYCRVKKCGVRILYSKEADDVYYGEEEDEDGIHHSSPRYKIVVEAITQLTKDKCIKILKSSIRNSIPDEDDYEEEEGEQEDETHSKRLKISTFSKGGSPSSSRQICCASITCDGQSSYIHWDLNKLNQDFSRMRIDATSATKQICLGHKPQSKRLKDMKRKRGR